MKYRIHIIIILISITNLNKYFIAWKYSQNLNNDENNGVLGGTISSYLNLSNEFMVTFWFKFIDFNNTNFPFITIFEEKKILKEYIFYKNNLKISSIDEILKILSIKKNFSYFCKIEFSLNSANEEVNLKFTLFNDDDKFEIIQSNLKTKTNINDFIFIINRYNLKENLIIERLIYYDCIECYSNEYIVYGVSDVLYFINFKNNYPNTKWFINEINNEFGPSLNGKNNNFENMFNANFNEDNKEISWESSSGTNFINFNPTFISYIDQFKSFVSLHIFLKWDFYFNHLNDFSLDEYNFEILNYFENKFKIKIEIDNPSKDVTISFIYVSVPGDDYLIYSKKIPNPTLVNSKNFIDGNFFNLEFIAINLKRNFSSNYVIRNYLKFRNNTILCKENYCFFQKNLKYLYKLNFQKKLFVEFQNDLSKKLILTIFLKELFWGSGNLIIQFSNTFIVKSEIITNTVLLYHYSYENLERRFNLNDPQNHSGCNDNNCSICRKDLNICEYCYKDYYLSNNSCISNSDNSKFINNYSLLKDIDYSKTSYSTETISSLNYYKTLFNITSISNYFYFNININLRNDNLFDILLNIFSKNCKTSFNIFYSKIKKKQGTFIINTPFDNINCINELLIYNYNNWSNNNDWINYNVNINKENINCNKIYKDMICSTICMNNNYFNRFDDSLFYNTCSDEDIEYYVKNKGYFKYYYKCPFNCKNCIIDSNDLINCTQCEEGYILKNNECIIKLMVNCNTESNFNISNNSTNINLFRCDNFCQNMSNNSDKNYLIRYYKNSRNCENKDEIILKCKNSNNYFLNRINNNCEKCKNNDCVGLICNNCNYTNNFYSCSDNYIFKNYECIKKNYYDLNCLNFSFNIYLNLIVCNSCKENYYLDNLNYNCYERNTEHCLNYWTDSYKCKNCINGYYIDYLNNCIKCHENCLNCQFNSKLCISCKLGYYLENNKCFLNKIYKKNCKKFNLKDLCTICFDGYFLNSKILCEKCNYNCITCINNKNHCLSCKLGYVIINKECKKKPNYCIIYNNKNVLKCDKCLKGYILTDNLKCIKCNSNCLNCELNPKNCTLCYKNSLLIKNLNNNYCKEKCINNKFIFEKNIRKCIKCEIKNYKEYKLYDKSIKYNKNEINTLNFNKIKSLNKYFIILNIPNYVNLFNKNIKNYFEIKNNKINQYIEFLFDIDIKNKKIILIPIINSYLKKISFNIKIKNNIFNDFKECIFEEKILKFNIINYNYNNNWTNYKNEIEIKNEINYPIYNENSEEYKKIKVYYEITKNTTNILFISGFILSIFSPSILSKLSIFLPTLLFFNYLVILKINFGKNINTIFSFINFNPKIYDLINYLKLDKKIINKRISYFLKLNPKFLRLKLLSINYMTSSYLLLNWSFLLIILFNFFKYSIILIKKIYFYYNILKIKTDKFFSKNKISNHKRKTFNIISFKNISTNSVRKVLVEKKFYKINRFIKIVNDFLITYYFGFLISEIPNILLIIITYSSSFNIEYFSYTSIIINLITIYNSILIVFFFILNNYFLNFFKMNTDTKDKTFYLKLFKFYKPFEIENKFINYYKSIENLRLIILLIIIWYVNYNVKIQIIWITMIQWIFLIYLLFSLSLKFFLVILFIKELFIFLFCFSLIFLNFGGLSILIENIITILIIMIFILSISEFAFINLKKIFGLLHLLWLKIFKKKSNKVINVKLKASKTELQIINLKK